MATRTRSDLPDLPHHPIPVDQVVIEIVPDPAHPGGRLVLQDGVESSYIDIANPARLGFEYQRHLANVIDVLHPKRLPLAAFQIGGGPCALMRYLDATRRELDATVAECDAGVLEVAERYLGLRRTSRLDLRVGDGRVLLAGVAPGSLDLLVVDAFLGLVVPHSLVTAEFTELARRVLRPDGMHVVNLIDIPPHDFARAVGATLAERYGEVVVLADASVLDGDASGNVVLAATDRPVALDHIARRSGRDTDPWQVIGGRRLRRWVGDAGPLRDDIAPTHDLALFGELFGRARRPREAS